MRVRAGVASDRGLIRSSNEDSFLLRQGLYAVCDGMGGARGGEVASQMACLGLLGIDPGSAEADQLRKAVVKANLAIVQRSATESGLLGMGTTLTSALVRDETLYVAHVGDSRGYLLHKGHLTQITEDHSWVGEMMRRGELTKAQAARHPHRSVITRALGTDMELAPDMTEIQLAAGDRVLLCSDGLSGMVDDDAIAEILEQGLDPQATAQRLVEAALDGGGEDNVTVLVIDAEADEDEGEEGEDFSWEDSRVLIGPSDREASVAAGSRAPSSPAKAAKLRRGRRGLSLSLSGARGGGDSGADFETGETDDSRHRVRGAGSDGAEGGTADEKTGDTASEESETVPPPTGRGRRKKGAPQRPEGRSRRRRWLLAVIIVLLVLVAGIGSFAWYNSTVYYLGESDGDVALYRGLPGDFLGIDLSWVHRTAPVEPESLLPYERARVLQNERVSKEEGEQFLDGLSTEP